MPTNRPPVKSSKISKNPAPDAPPDPENAGLITDDQETGTITPGPNYDEIEHLL